MNSEAFNRFIELLKAIRMGWLVPFFLLAKGEDPKAQCRAIVGGVVIPAVAILLFLVFWSVASKRIVTKFGTVPGPRQVLSAWGSLMNEMRLEEIKEEDHVRRLRDRRIQYLERYESTLAAIDMDLPDFGDMEKNKEAMKQLETVFEEVNEVLEVSNKITVAPDVESAEETIASFRFESSKNLGGRIIKKLLPLELAHKADLEAFNSSPLYNPEPGDSDEKLAEKERLKNKQAKVLADKKAIRKCIAAQNTPSILCRR